MKPRGGEICLPVKTVAINQNCKCDSFKCLGWQQRFPVMDQGAESLSYCTQGSFQANSCPHETNSPLFLSKSGRSNLTCQNSLCYSSRIPAIGHFMWHADKTGTRLFCDFLRKTWLKIVIATGEKKMKLLKDMMHQKRTSETMQFHCSLIRDAALAHRKQFPL